MTVRVGGERAERGLCLVVEKELLCLSMLLRQEMRSAGAMIWGEGILGGVAEVSVCWAIWCLKAEGMLRTQAHAEDVGREAWSCEWVQT